MTAFRLFVRELRTAPKVRKAIASDASLKGEYRGVRFDGKVADVIEGLKDFDCAEHVPARAVCAKRP